MSWVDWINLFLGVFLGIMIGIWIGIVIGSGDSVFEYYDD